MTKKRAAGGGRKPLNPNEKTTKVAVTLLPSQVEAMTQLGNGNLSAGIRKAIDSMNTYSKLLDLTAGSRTNPVHAQIQFSGTLTPAVAIEAAKRAFGHANGVTVKDPETATTYRLTNGKAKNITDPEEAIQAEMEQEWRRQQAAEHMNQFE